MEAIKQRYKKQQPKKGAMLPALEKHLGVVTDSCQEAGICRTTHYRWLKEDPEYREAVDEIGDVSLDFAESKLLDQIRNGNTTATIFYLKTKGRKRGYIERQDFDHTTGGDKINEVWFKMPDGD